MTCPGCNQPLEPLAQVRTYHTQCDPQGRVEMLERALRELVESVEEQLDDDDIAVAIDPTERFVQAIRDAKTWLAHRPAQMKGRE